MKKVTVYYNNGNKVEFNCIDFKEENGALIIKPYIKCQYYATKDITIPLNNISGYIF